jgi:membrane-bound lytic murein transglycosylase A
MSISPVRGCALPATAVGLVLATALAACSSVPKAPGPEGVPSAVPAAATQAPAACSCPEPAAEKPAVAPITWENSLAPVGWGELPGWTDDNLSEAVAPLLRSCAVLRAQAAWQAACEGAQSLDAGDRDAVRRFFESAFTPYAVVNADGSRQGTVTGYYEPLLRGSRRPGGAYRYAVHAVPEDLLVVDLSELYPELKPMRLRGRVDGRRVVPYYSRAELDAGKGAIAGREILWVDDAIELFFLQIQGSGKVRLDTGETVRLSYAEQNGHPYRSVGRLLVERGELTLDQASMQGIKAWAARNPGRLQELLNQNGSYVFFRELPATDDGPPGALGIALSAGRSLAVDPRAVPLGAPVFLSTTWPNAPTPLRRLMLAHDTGGAIRGAVRADFYWGSGEEAGALAGRMRQPGELFVLLPIGFPLKP